MAEQGKEAFQKALKNAKGPEQELDCSLGPEHSRMELPKPCSLVSSLGFSSYGFPEVNSPSYYMYMLFFAMHILLTVDAGHRAIMSNRIGGLSEEVYKEGLHFRVPWCQYPIVYDIRARPNQIRSPTGSKDLQMVNIGLTGRSACFDFNLILYDVSLTELTFSPQYSAAVEVSLPSKWLPRRLSVPRSSSPSSSVSRRSPRLREKPIPLIWHGNAEFVLWYIIVESSGAQVIPLYGRGGNETDPRDKVPPRPRAHRQEASQGFPGFHFGDGTGQGGMHFSLGIGVFPFSIFASIFNSSMDRRHSMNGLIPPLRPHPHLQCPSVPG
ncbi:hypothetical protein PRIPAC_83388 [Pristionchus pacificus]|nr:hypothetical protein PRIPAC_83388 [Pristionchus pacificus]|eukprot:PDM68671.1 hypothetical protein PRIPAC_46973 [Pristionchus pacificus]